MLCISIFVLFNVYVFRFSPAFVIFLPLFQHFFQEIYVIQKFQIAFILLDFNILRYFQRIYSINLAFLLTIAVKIGSLVFCDLFSLFYFHIKKLHICFTSFHRILFCYFKFNLYSFCFSFLLFFASPSIYNVCKFIGKSFFCPLLYYLFNPLSFKFDKISKNTIKRS